MNNNFRSVGILGTGRYLPEKVVSNYDIEKIVDTSHDWIVSRTGIHTRRIAEDNIATSDLSTEAAKIALERANITAEDLDLIIVATVTPDMQFPSTACIVQSNLGAKNAAAFDLSAACSGFLYGISIADQFIKTGLYNHVLVIGAETLSKILNWNDRNTCVLFGDGAGAVVLGPTEDGSGILSTHLGADGNGGKFLNVPAGGSRMPSSVQTVEDSLHYIKMDGSEVFKFAVRIMGNAAKEALKLCDLGVEDIDYLVPHQANTRIISSAAKRLKLPMEKVYVNLDAYGNMSAASIPVALDEALEKGKIKKGDNVVLVGFGGGLTWGSCVIKW
ncbi:beta-ketoacyl-ACP synthase III [Wukongibacter baidiensis]|uniref:beta-ketoacyl-ACP synthase III n=1 Tax=Wukongibacter baidiensis TaxID=1723361 RepID=UPI003D7F2681